MVKLFGNLVLVLAIGVALAVLIMLFPDSGYRPPTGDLVNGVLQWLHVFFGITWIGLLYYFNFVQVPALKAAAADGTDCLSARLRGAFCDHAPHSKAHQIKSAREEIPRALWLIRWD